MASGCERLFLVLLLLFHKLKQVASCCRAAPPSSSAERSAADIKTVTDGTETSCTGGSETAEDCGLCKGGGISALLNFYSN